MSLNKKIGLIVIVNIIIILSLEVVARSNVPLEEKFKNASPANLLDLLSKAPINGRELDNQFIIHNTSLFSMHPNKDDISRAYIGTSRSKMLRPSWYGNSSAVNASGNSYNEISFGLLLQAEMLRLQFPNLKEVFVEASLLLRRPDSLIIEEDHKKYISVLREVLSYKDAFSDQKSFSEGISKLESGVIGSDKSVYFDERKKYQIANWIGFKSDVQQNSLLGYEEPYMKSLNKYGERISKLSLSREVKDQLPSIAESNVKVQRLRDVEGWYPWDGLFEMFALWGKDHGIKIIFYQPPVRSDLYEFQLKYGMERHRKDLKRVVEKYNVPFIDFNKPDLGFSTNWSLFVDEDHLDTCLGVVYYLVGLETGYERFIKNGTLINEINIQEVIGRSAKMVTERCQN